MAGSRTGFSLSRSAASTKHLRTLLSEHLKSSFCNRRQTSESFVSAVDNKHFKFFNFVPIQTSQSIQTPEVFSLQSQRHRRQLCLLSFLLQSTTNISEVLSLLSTTHLKVYSRRQTFQSLQTLGSLADYECDGDHLRAGGGPREDHRGGPGSDLQVDHPGAVKVRAGEGGPCDGSSWWSRETGGPEDGSSRGKGGPG